MPENIVRKHPPRKKLIISIIPQALPSVHGQHPLATFLSLPTRLLNLHFLYLALLHSRFEQLRSFVLPEVRGRPLGLLRHASSPAERASELQSGDRDLRALAPSSKATTMSVVAADSAKDLLILVPAKREGSRLLTPGMKSPRAVLLTESFGVRLLRILCCEIRICRSHLGNIANTYA